MQSSRFGTDHERYIGSGIVTLSQLPNASDDDLIVHKQEIRDLKKQFGHGTYKPWLKESRLKAEISQCHWKSRRIAEYQRLGEHDFPRLQFTEDTRISIVESMALLEVLRSSQTLHPEQSFDRLEGQWVVDFFCKGKTVFPSVTTAGM